MPGKRTFALVAAAGEKAAVFNQSQQEGGSVASNLPSSAVASSSSSLAAAVSSGPLSLVSLLVESAFTGQDTSLSSSSASSSSLVLALKLTSSEAEALSRLERWRRTAALVRSAVEANPTEDSHALDLTHKYGKHYASSSLQDSQQHHQSDSTSSSFSRPLPMGSGSPGAGRAMGAGEAFDSAFLSSSANASASRGKPQVGVMDRIFAQLASCVPYLSAAAKSIATANGVPSSDPVVGMSSTSSSSGSLSFLELNEVAVSSFAVHVLVLCSALVARQGGASLGLRQGHVALGTLHSFQLLSPPKLPATSSSNLALESAEVDKGASKEAMMVQENQVQLEGRACLPWLAKDVSTLLSDALAGAPELLLFELVRSLLEKTKAMAQAWIQGGGAQKAEALHLDYGAVLPPATSDNASSEAPPPPASVEEEAPLVGNDLVSNLPKCLARCKELLAAVAKSTSGGGGSGGGLGNVPPAVTAMLLQVVATGFVGAFKEERNSGGQEGEGEAKEAPAVLRQRCLALAVGLVNQLAEARVQARSIASDPLIGRALSRALLASLPSVARCPPPPPEGGEHGDGGIDSGESQRAAAAAVAEAEAKAAAAAAAKAQRNRAAAEEDAYTQPVKWACAACTFGNEKPFSTASDAVYCCEMCETPYESPPRAPPMAVVAAQPLKPPPPPPSSIKAPPSSQAGASKVPLDEAMSRLPPTTKGEWFVQHLLKPISELCGKLQPYRSFLDSALFKDFKDDEDNDNDTSSSTPSAAARPNSGSDSQALVVQAGHGDLSGKAHVKLPFTHPASSSSSRAAWKSLSAPMCCLMDVLVLSVRAVPEARKHAACVAVVLKLMAAASSSSAHSQGKSGQAAASSSANLVRGGFNNPKGGKGGVHRLAEAYARATRADNDDAIEWQASHGCAALVSTSLQQQQPSSAPGVGSFAEDGWLEGPLDLALTGLRLLISSLSTSSSSSSSAPASHDESRRISVTATARASMVKPPPGSLVVSAVATTTSPTIMTATAATATAVPLTPGSQANTDSNAGPVSVIDQIAMRVTLLRGVIDVCLVAQHQASALRSAKKASALRENLSALLFADPGTTRAMVDVVLAGAAAPRTLQVSKMEQERELQQQQEEQDQLRATNSAETAWYRQKTAVNQSSNNSAASSGTTAQAEAVAAASAAAGAAKSTLEIALGLMELADHLSQSDECIAIMLFGPQANTNSSGSASLPVTRTGFVELVLRLLSAGGLSRIGGGDEQRRLNLSGLRALDHVATIEDEDMDAAATELLVQLHAPRAVLTVLQQGDSGRGGHGALALVSLDVQEAAVEALASLAYSSAAASELVEQGAVSLLVNIATSYDEAHALVLRCAQTLVLLLRDDAAASVRPGDNRTRGSVSITSRRASSVNWSNNNHQGAASTGALHSFAESGGVQLFLQLLQSVALDEREIQQGGGKNANSKAGSRGGLELRATALTLLGSLARSHSVTAELSHEASAVPKILTFLTKALAGGDRKGANGGGGGNDDDEEEESTRALEQSVDALTHLADYPSLNEQIGEHGMQLLLQWLGTALGDRRLSLLYLDLIKHLSVHDLNVKALVASDGISLLLCLLENAHDNNAKGGSFSRRAQEMNSAEAEQLVVKLELLILASLGNMVAASVEYAAVMEAAGCVRVLESCAAKAAERDNYEVRAKAVEVQQQFSRVDLTGLKSKMRSSSTSTGGGHRSSRTMSAAPQGSFSHSLTGGHGPMQTNRSSNQPKPPPPPTPPPPGSKPKPLPPPGPRPPPPPPTPSMLSSSVEQAISSHPSSLGAAAAANGAADQEADTSSPVTRLRNSSQVAAMKVEPTSRMGYLRKQGGGTSMLGRKSWKTRFFCLDGASLSYFDNEDSRDKPLNAQPFVLPFCDVLVDQGTGTGGEGKFRFTIKPCGSRGGKGPLLLEADSSGQRTQWVEWLNLAQKMRAPPL